MIDLEGMGFLMTGNPKIPELFPDDTALVHVVSCVMEAWQRIHHPECQQQ